MRYFAMAVFIIAVLLLVFHHVQANTGVVTDKMRERFIFNESGQASADINPGGVSAAGSQNQKEPTFRETNPGNPTTPPVAVAKVHRGSATIAIYFLVFAGIMAGYIWRKRVVAMATSREEEW